LQLHRPPYPGVYAFRLTMHSACNDAQYTHALTDDSHSRMMARSIRKTNDIFT